MIQEIEADIFKTPSDCLMHQCNCFCTMGAGLAREIKRRIPEAYRIDARNGRKGDDSKLGTVSYAEVISDRYSHIKYVANMYAQFDYGRGKCYTNYAAFSLCITRVLQDLPSRRIFTIPYKIGCGYGGGDWNTILGILKANFESSSRKTLKICKFTEKATEMPFPDRI